MPAGNVIVFTHTRLEGVLDDEKEFRDTLTDFAITADDYDDRIAARYGGSTMADLIEEQTVEHLRTGLDDPELWRE